MENDSNPLTDREISPLSTSHEERIFNEKNNSNYKNMGINTDSGLNVIPNLNTINNSNNLSVKRNIPDINEIFNEYTRLPLKGYHSLPYIYKHNSFFSKIINSYKERIQGDYLFSNNILKIHLDHFYDEENNDDQRIIITLESTGVNGKAIIKNWIRARKLFNDVTNGYLSNYRRHSINWKRIMEVKNGITIRMS